MCQEFCLQWGGMHAQWCACPGGVHAWGACVAGGMHGWEVCMPGGHAWLGGVCVPRGVHGWGACMALGDMCAWGRMCNWGACMAGGHAWPWGVCMAGGMPCTPPAQYHKIWLVNERVVRILLECILVIKCFATLPCCFSLLAIIILEYIINHCYHFLLKEEIWVSEILSRRVNFGVIHPDWRVE